MEVFFQIAVLIISVVAHEVAHGFAANYLGDPTARLSGRLTLNPLPHIDPVGSVLVPFILSLIPGGFIIGWAKPVPVNPYNLRGKFGEAIVASSGPLTNMAIALFFGLVIRFGFGSLSDSFLSVAALIVIINLVLALFNLVPIPPLDGSKILFNLFPNLFFKQRDMFERFGFFFVLIFVVFFWWLITPVIGFLFSLFTGLAF